jgi:hypothetical protein
MDNCADQSSICTSVDVSIGIIDIVIAGQQGSKNTVSGPATVIPGPAVKTPPEGDPTRVSVKLPSQ